MVRLLMKDSGKKIEALRVCRTFISNHRAVIARYERQNKCPAGMEAAWTFAACVSSVIRVCLDVDDAERLDDVGLLARLRDLVSDDGSDIAKLNAKFHRAVGQLLLEARDALTLDDANVACVTDASEPAAILDEMLRVPASTFAARKPASSLTPQNSLSTPRASAMASMASAFTHHDTSKSLENVDLDGAFIGMKPSSPDSRAQTRSRSLADSLTRQVFTTAMTVTTCQSFRLPCLPSTTEAFLCTIPWRWTRRCRREAAGTQRSCRW